MFFDLFKKLEKNEIFNFYFDSQLNKLLQNVHLTNVFVFCGSFNPLTHGHCKIIQAIYQMYPKASVSLELTILNPDKGFVAAENVWNRFSLISQKELNVLFTQRPLFADKIDFLQDCSFVVGGDTIIRILDLKYYHNSVEQLEQFQTKLNSKEIKFLTFPRFDSKLGVVVDKKLVLEQLDQRINHDSWDKMITEVGGFREDISSSEIRDNSKQNLIEEFEFKK